MSRGASTMLTQLPARVARFPWADVDRRSRPAREIAADYWRLTTDLGGIDSLSTQQLALVERAAFLLLRIRAHESAVLAGRDPPTDAGVHSNQKRRDALLHERNAIAYRHPMPTADAIASHNAALSRLDAELAALPKPEEQKTGEGAGIVAIGEFHGDAWSPPPREEPFDPDSDHPHIREYGTRIK
jgi:hypothetical protein